MLYQSLDPPSLHPSQFPLSYYAPYLNNKLHFSLDPTELNLSLAMEYVKATEEGILPRPLLR